MTPLQAHHLWERVMQAISQYQERVLSGERLLPAPGRPVTLAGEVGKILQMPTKKVRTNYLQFVQTKEAWLIRYAMTSRGKANC